MSEKLSKMQAELLAAINAGAKATYMPYMGSFRQKPYFFRSDTLRRCTAAAKALEARGLVRRVNRDIHGHYELIALAKEPKE